MHIDIFRKKKCGQALFFITLQHTLCFHGLPLSYYRHAFVILTPSTKKYTVGYIYINMYINVVYIYIYIYIYIHKHLHLYTYEHKYSCVYIHMYQQKKCGSSICAAIF